MATSPLDSLDPTVAQTPEEFMQMLRQACRESGLSTVEIARRARMRGYDLDPAGLDRELEQPTLPGWQTVTGVLAAGGLGGMQIDRWMRVYHELAAPAQPVAAPEPGAEEPFDPAPVSVPPLVLTTTTESVPRLGPRTLAVAGGVVAALVMVPLLLFAVLNEDPDTVAAGATSPPPRTGAVAPPAPWPTDPAVASSSPIESAAPTTPGTVPTTTKPPPRTTAPASPPRPPASPPDSGVLRSGAIELTGNQGFDLDSGQTEGERDIYRWNSDTVARLNGSQLEPVSGTPSKQTCQGETGWEEWVSNLQVGQWLCVRTSDGRYGRLNITAIGGTLKLAYTVWT